MPSRRSAAAAAAPAPRTPAGCSRSVCYGCAAAAAPCRLASARLGSPGLRLPGGLGLPGFLGERVEVDHDADRLVGGVDRPVDRERAVAARQREGAATVGER